MKWLFSLLVLANIALLIWGLQREQVVPEVSMQEKASIGEMRLLSESRSTEIQPPAEAMPSETAQASEEDESQPAGQEPGPQTIEQAGTDTSSEIVVDPAQAGESPETEVAEKVMESEQTAQVAEAAPAEETIEAAITAGTQESPEDDQPPAASTESEPAGESSGTPPEDIASGALVQEEQPGDSPESAAKAEEARYCGTVGPLEEETDANALQEALTEREMDAVLRKESVKKTAGFWVIITPYATQQEARAEESRLASKGVTDYRRFYRGEFKNGISLGIYSRRRNAEIRRAAIEAEGFSPVLVPRTRRITEFWLDFKAAPADKADNQNWLAENHPKLNAKDQSCSPVE